MGIADLQLRPLPPASGARRSDAGRDLLRTDAVALVRDPASSRQAGRRPDGLAVSGRVPRRGTDAACARSKSCLKGVTRGDTPVDVCAHGGIVVAEALVCVGTRAGVLDTRPLVCAPVAGRNLHFGPLRTIAVSA